MATRFELVLPAANTAAALAPIGELVMAEIDEWHQRLNRFAPDSWITHVNRTAAAAAVRCDEDVWEMLVNAHTVWQQSGGAFDITRGHGHALILDAATRTVRFGEPTMAIDLGGIAKGHAIDCCARLLRANGVTSAFLHGGTSSGVAIGLDPSGHPWKVDLGTPGPAFANVRRGSRCPELSPRGKASAGFASGLRIVDFAFSVSDAGSQSHPHIVDPRSGAPVEPQAPGVVVVTGPSARLCDAWSTAYVVMGTTAVIPGHSRVGQMITIGAQSPRHG
jgi:FAD:protein FMN transferase